jgi:hypothetical protein
MNAIIKEEDDFLYFEKAFNELVSCKDDPKFDKKLSSNFSDFLKFEKAFDKKLSSNFSDYLKLFNLKYLCYSIFKINFINKTEKNEKKVNEKNLKKKLNWFLKNIII